MKQKNKITKAILLGVAICFTTTNMFAQVQKWVKTYNGAANQQDVGTAVTTDASGNVYVTGRAQIGTSPTNYEIRTIKYNVSGTIVWSVGTDNGNNGTTDFEGGSAIAVDANDNVWVTGTRYNGATNNYDIVLIKYNSSGVIQANYPKVYAAASGASDEAKGTCVYVYNSTNVYIGGRHNISGSWYGVVLKDNTAGSGWTWTYTFSDNVLTTPYGTTDIKADVNYVYATGYKYNSTTGADCHTVKLNASTGVVQAGWPVTYSATNQDFSWVMYLSGSDVYIAGSTNPDPNGSDGALMVKYNGAGTQLWVHKYSNSNRAETYYDIVGGGLCGSVRLIYAVGYISQNIIPSQWDDDYLLSAIDISTGNLATCWSTNPIFYNGNAGVPELVGADRGYAIEYSSSTNRVYITGRAYENNPSNNINLTTVGYNGSNGSLVWGPARYDYGGDGVFVGRDEVTNKYGMVVKYNATYCVDDIYLHGESWINHNPGINFDYLTLKYSCGICNPCLGPSGGGRVMMNTDQMQAEIELYPNPFNNNAVLKLSDETEISDGTLTLYDIMGNVVSISEHISSNTIVISKGNMPNGLYFYSLTDKGNILSGGKFIIAD